MLSFITGEMLAPSCFYVIRSGSTQFSIEDISGFSRTRVYVIQP